MEIPGLDPGITICKIAVLPVKLYPLLCKNIIVKISADKGFAPLYLDHESIMLLITSTCIYLSEKRLERSRFSSINLKIILSTNSSTRTKNICK